MIEKILDLHIHSKYSRACSPQLTLPNIAQGAARKGVNIISTGDFTHPDWFKQIKENLIEDSQGLYKLKGDKTGVKFILGTEVAVVYKHRDKVRRLHLLIFFPGLDDVEKFNGVLKERGINIRSDGRPIMGMSAKELLNILLAVNAKGMMIPAHAWTPWFGLFGSKSGYDSIEECFEELTPEIRAIETGLSSDPPMNHRLSKLDSITLISNSDAHSPDNIGREANVMAFKDEASVTYDEIFRIIKDGDQKNFLYTIEFYPEEGMYHFDGHRDCHVSLSPAETKKEKMICPRCKKKLTVGVLHRVEDLADQKNEDEKFIPHKYVVPLREIIGTVLEVGPKCKGVEKERQNLLKYFKSEFEILLKADIEKINQHACHPAVGQAIKNMREGKVKVVPGYDGEYGKVEVLLDDGHFKRAKQSRLML